MLEKFYSVAVEMEDGHRKTLAVKAKGSGQAFASAKAAEGVRRVGKVTEIDADDFAHVGKGGTIKEKPADRQPSRDRQGESGRKSEKPSSPAQRKTLTPAEPIAARPSGPYANTGPRIVTHVRTRTGEQPFKHLQAPPERPKPPAPPAAPAKKSNAAKAAATKVTKADKPAKPKAAKALAKKSSEKKAPADDNTRIVKSRRQDGPPYLLQLGAWKEVGGKRVFTVESEKGFDTREAAEAAMA